MIVRIFAVLVLLIYPFAVWQLLERSMIASAALFLAVAALLSACIKRSPIGFICVACALVLAFCAGVLDMQNALKLYPVFVNAALFTVFAASLRGTPMVETFARLRHKNLPAHAVVYCRRVTVVWCVFFIVNGLVALDSALFRSDAWWALYNGAVSYVLIAMLFAAEFAVRMYVQRKHEASGETP